MRRSCARRLLAALSLLCMLGISPGYAQGPIAQTAAQAMAIARQHVARYGDRIAAWRTATVASPTPYYDLEGQVAVYVVPVVDRGHDIGHVVVSSQALPNPVLAFSTAPAPHRAAHEAIRAQADSLGLIVHERVPLYLGPLSYFYPIEQGTKMSLLEMGRGRRIDLDPAVADRLARAVRTIEGTPASPPVEDSAAALPASSLGATALKRLYGPDYLWYVGCGPTAAGNLMGYWADRGYPALVLGGSDGDYTGTIERLGQLMGTNEAGWTWLPIDDDLQDFAQERGYAFRTSERSSPPYSDYVAEIDAHRPLVVLVNGHELYGNHFITGFGYEYEPGNDTYRYMIVHDTWWSTAEDYWIQYGAGYSAIWFDTVVPPAVEVDTIPPTSSVAPLPPFQTTPSFSVHWSGTDIGWGTAWYDVQVRDGADGVWADWITHTDATAGTFTGLTGHSYAFRSRAVDIDRNAEPYPGGDGDARTAIAAYLLSGHVSGNRGMPVIGAQVTVAPHSLGATPSDAQGAYMAGIGAAGSYTLSVAGSAGFGTLPPTHGVAVNEDIAGLDWVLPPAIDWVADGGWESGTLAQWATGGTIAPAITTTAHTGDYGVVLGQRAVPGAGTSAISQTVALPPTVADATLSFLLRADAAHALTDALSVTLSGSTEVMTRVVALGGGDWQHAWFDVSAFAGETIEVRFLFTSGDSARVWIDEVSLGPAAREPSRAYLPAVLREPPD